MTAVGAAVRRGRAGGVVGLVVCLIAVIAMVWTLPKDEPTRRAYAVAPGQDWYAWRDLELRLVSSAYTTAIRESSGDTVRAAPEAGFVVVVWQLRARREPVRVPRQILVVDGLSVDNSVSLSEAPSDPIQPGFTHTSTTVYEIPRDHAKGNALSVVTTGASGLTAYREFPALRIPLGAVGEQPVEIAEPVTEVTR